MKRRYLILPVLLISIVSGCAQPPVAIPTPHPTEEAKPPAEESQTTPMLIPPEEAPTSEQITTSGHITRDEMWSGTLRITGDIFVDSGVTLTILPGTTVLFAAHSDDQHSGRAFSDPFVESRDDPARSLEYAQSHIEIIGKIMARGTPDKMITFTSDSLSPHYADWVRITLWSGSIMEYCIVEYNLSGICPLGENITVSYNMVRHVLWGGICSSHCSPAICHNHISDCGHEGIDVHAGSPVIGYNTVTQSHNGMIITEGASPIVEHNTLVDNANCGIGMMENSSGVIRNNKIITLDRQVYYEWTYQGRTIYWGRPSTGMNLGGASPTIVNNDLSGNPLNIRITGNSSPTISHNVITDGDHGILFDSPFIGNARIYENNICNNIHNIALLSGVTDPVSVSNNWWGTTDIDEIGAKIHDYYDDPSLGKVNYQLIATSKIAPAGPQD